MKAWDRSECFYRRSRYQQLSLEPCPQTKFDDIDGTGGNPDYIDEFLSLRNHSKRRNLLYTQQTGSTTRTKFSLKNFLPTISIMVLMTLVPLVEEVATKDCDENGITGGAFP